MTSTKELRRLLSGGNLGSRACNLGSLNIKLVVKYLKH